MEIVKDLGQILNQEEIQSISNSIKENKNLWTHESVYWGKKRINEPINFLGSPVYPAKQRPGLYRKLRPLSQQYLIDTSSTMLSRVLKLLTELHNVSTAEQLTDTSLPGYHVMTSPQKWHRVYSYHIDRDYLEYYEEFNETVPYNFDDFYSFTVVVEVPKAGATVDFKIDDQEIKYPYTVGHAYTWKSDIFHKIGDVILDDDTDYRITFQGHFILQPDKLLYYW